MCFLWKESDIMICPICESDHCSETNIDDTIGCCICFNKFEKVKKMGLPITICKGCKEYDKHHS